MATINVQYTFNLLVVATAILFPHPVSSSSCSVDDLTAAKSILLTSVNANDSLQQPTSETALKRCPALTSISETLHQLRSTIRQLEQAGICNDRVRNLRNTFEQKLEKVESIESLQAWAHKLRTELQSATRELYENAVESVVKLLSINQALSVGSASKRKPTPGPLDELSPDYRLHLSPLQYLNRTNNEALLGFVYDGILSRLNKLEVDAWRQMNTGRNDLVTLLCWTVNNRLLDNKFREKKSEILRLALQFYPKGGDGKLYEVDILRRKTCKESFPDTVIRNMALGIL